MKGAGPSNLVVTAQSSQPFHPECGSISLSSPGYIPCDPVLGPVWGHRSGQSRPPTIGCSELGSRLMRRCRQECGQAGTLQRGSLSWVPLTPRSEASFCHLDCWPLPICTLPQQEVPSPRYPPQVGLLASLLLMLRTSWSLWSVPKEVGSTTPDSGPPQEKADCIRKLPTPKLGTKSPMIQDVHILFPSVPPWLHLRPRAPPALAITEVSSLHHSPQSWEPEAQPRRGL